MSGKQNASGEQKGKLKGYLDYLLGRNALIGVAALMLLALSGYATWKGMHDFILGVQANTGTNTLGGPAGLEIQTEWLIILLVVALTFLMWLALRETFGAKRSPGARAITLPLYLFLALWSIGFGYGFWWSLIAGPEATRSGLSGQAEDVRDAAVTVKARLEAVRARLSSVVSHSERQMRREDRAGGSCGVDSGAGRGKLYRAREGVRDSVAALQTNIAADWLAAVDADLNAISAELGEAESAETGGTIAERQARYNRAAADIRGRAGALSAKSNALGKAYAAEMRELANEVSNEPNQPNFSCYDPSLAALLRKAADEAEVELDVTLRQAAFSEGAAGVANAVLSLWTKLGSFIFGEADGAAPAGDITGRDLIALLATLGVDIGLFALTVLNPPPPPRLSGAAEAEVKRAIGVTLQRSGKDLEWLKKHIFHHGKSAYLAVPNFYSCLNPEMIESSTNDELAVWAERDVTDDNRKTVIEDLSKELDGDEAQKGQALNLLAGVLVDIKLIRLLRRGELKAALRDEKRVSRSVAPKKDEADMDAIRNHGILSKARHALKNARWSRHARKDVEIYLLIDTEGLSPFLKAFNQAGAGAVEKASPDQKALPSPGKA